MMLPINMHDENIVTVMWVLPCAVLADVEFVHEGIFIEMWNTKVCFSLEYNFRFVTRSAIYAFNISKSQWNVLFVTKCTVKSEAVAVWDSWAVFSDSKCNTSLNNEIMLNVKAHTHAPSIPPTTVFRIQAEFVL